MKKITEMILLLLMPGSLLAQYQLTGKVKDAAGRQPIPGVTVQLKSSRQGAVTAADGSFHLSVKAGDTLLVTMLGYNKQEMPLHGQTFLDIVLQSADKQLDQVVVVGYGTQRKADVTGVIASVGAKEIAGRPVSSAMQALEGKIAGVTVRQKTGAPGESPAVLIRGVGTTGNNAPLYVVDGMFVNDIQYLSPADITDMQVLKDASSLAIYGVRGANGVIIITTRSGKAGKAQVSYNVSAGFQQVTHPIKMTNAAEFATLVNESAANAGDPPYFSNPDSLGKGTNWQDAIFCRAFTMDHALHISGGSEKNIYSFGVDYLTQDGVVNTSGYKRLTVSLNNEYKINAALKAGNNIVLSHANTDIVPEDVVRQAYWFDPTIPVQDAAGKYGYSNLNTALNPAAMLAYNNNSNTGNRLVGTVYGELAFLRNFTFRSSIGTDLMLVDSKNYKPVYNVSGVQQNLQSNLAKARNEAVTWLWENTLTYQATLRNHHLKILGGYTAQAFKQDNFSGNRNNVPADANLQYLSAGSPDGQQVGNSAPDYNAFLSTLVRLNYDYNHKYLLTISYRHDGSSKFGTENRYGNFGSAGIGWNMQEEPFIKRLQFFDVLKLRGSWGVLGNDKIADNAYYQLVNTTFYGVFGPGETLQQGATVTTVANPGIRWEKIDMKNAGVEIAILHNRLSLEMDYYDRLTRDMQVSVPIPATVGANAPVVNAAGVSNRGFEATLRWNDRVGDITYGISANMSTLRNRVLNLGNGGKPIIGGNLPIGGISVTKTDIGQPIGSFYGLKTIGVFQSTDEIKQSPKQQDPVIPGDLKFANINGDSVIDNNDRVYLGSPIPTLTYGISLSLGYKHWDLSADFQGVSGNKIYNAKKQFSFGTLNYEASTLGRWHGEGTSNAIPRVGIDAANNYRVSDYFMESGAFFRLNNIQLGYTLSAAALSRLKIGSLRIYASGMNLWTITGYSGFTPEIGGGPVDTGVDLSPYPVASSLVVGLNVRF